MLNTFSSKIRFLLGHKGFVRYTKNTAWLLAENMVRLVLMYFIGFMVARYLGPEKFGKLNYITAFVMYFMPIGKLGLDGIVSRNVAREETGQTTLINTTIVLRLIGSGIAFVLTSCYMLLFEDDRIYFYLTLVFASMLIIQSFEIIVYYFRAKVKGKLISISYIIGAIIAGALKLIFVLFSFTLLYFAVAYFIEIIVAMGILIFLFRSENIKLSLKLVKFKKGLEYLKESWPLTASGVFALIYLNIDIFMIKNMLNAFEVGQYSAAVKLSSIWSSIPLIIVWSIQTAIVNAKKQRETSYYRKLQLGLTTMAILAYIIILPIVLFANPIVDFLYGAEYYKAGNVLALHIVSILFIFVGSIRGLWILNESHFKFVFVTNMSAGILNIALNYLLLPSYGIKGAAWATLFSYFVSNLATGMFFRPARKIFIMQVRAILLLDTIKLYKSIG